MIIWRRHVAPCESTDHSDMRCGCPIYQEFRVNGKRFRRSLKTRNWQKALAEARQNELRGFTEHTKSPTVEQACDKYIEDAKARHLKEPTLYKFTLLSRQLKEFAADKGLVFVSDFDLDRLRQFRATWANKNEAARVKLGNLKSFFRFCHESKWVSENPAVKLKAGKVTESKIVPLTVEEFKRILVACEKHGNRKNRKRLRALVLLMYYSALRIRDCVMLSNEAVQNGKLYLRTTKTGTDVFCPLPKEATNALEAVREGKYFFQTGAAKPKSVVGDYQRALRKVFENAKVPRAFPHLFRHTCITNWLAAGMPVAIVAVLAGHSSTKMTERRYSHWIKARQENLEAEVKKSWAQTGTLG